MLRSNLKLNIRLADYYRIPLVKLRKAVEAGDRLALLELILRSPLNGGSEVRLDEALNICRDELKRESDQDLNVYCYRLALALKAWDDGRQDEALSHLKIITSVDYPAHDLIKGQAEYALAFMHTARKEFRQAAAWLTRAIILGSSDAERYYLNLSFLSPKTRLPDELCNTSFFDKTSSTCSLLQSILFGLILSGKRLEKFADSALASNLTKPCKTICSNAQAVNPGECLKQLKDNNSNITKLASFALDNDQYIYFNYFKICFRQRIISDDIYFAAMEYFLQNASDPRLKNKAAYNLYQIALKQGLASAAEYLQKVDSAFFTNNNKHHVSVYAYIEKIPDEHKLIILNKLYAARRYNEVLIMLNKIRDFSKIALDISECRRKAVNAAILECVILLEAYIRDREGRVKDHPLRFFLGDLLLKNGREREDYVTEFRKKAAAGKGDLAFLDEFLRVIREGNAKFPPGSTGKMAEAFEQAHRCLIRTRDCVTIMAEADRIAHKLGTDAPPASATASPAPASVVPAAAAGLYPSGGGLLYAASSSYAYTPIAMPPVPVLDPLSQQPAALGVAPLLSAPGPQQPLPSAPPLEAHADQAPPPSFSSPADDEVMSRVAEFLARTRDAGPGSSHTQFGSRQQQPGQSGADRPAEKKKVALRSSH